MYSCLILIYFYSSLDLRRSQKWVLYDSSTDELYVDNILIINNEGSYGNLQYTYDTCNLSLHTSNWFNYGENYELELELDVYLNNQLIAQDFSFINTRINIPPLNGTCYINH